MSLKQSKTKFIIVLIIFITALFFISGCENKVQKKTKELVIAEQYGLAYAPVQLLKELKIMENSAPQLKIEWKQLSNTAAIRESMLAGKVDLAFMAVPPFLIAQNKGMDWKIISGLSESPLGLMVNRDDINSLADFKADDKIALPQPGSVQHILLSMAAAEEFNDSQYFDQQLLTMRHPDAMNALLAGRDTAAHFASPPYLFLESREEGIREIMSGREAFGGEFTFIVGVCISDFYQEQPQKYQLFKTSLNKALQKLNNEKAAAAEILADNYDLEFAEIKEYLSWPGLKYGTKVKGLERFIGFMRSEGYLTEKDYQLSDLVFEPELIFETKKTDENDKLNETDKIDKNDKTEQLQPLPEAQTFKEADNFDQ